MIIQKTPAHGRLHGLDHLRAFAIFFVFIYHYGRMFSAPPALTAIGKFGWTGVDLFFVLSGYLIASHLFREISKKQLNLPVYFIKRIFRIIPIYLLVVLVYFQFPLARERESLAPLWKYLTFTQNIALDLRFQGTFSHAWSLCIEEQFYLLFPIVLFILVYLKRVSAIYWLLGILVVCGFAARIYIWLNIVGPFTGIDNGIILWYKWIYYFTVCRLDGLVTGIFIAAVFEFKPSLRIRIASFGNLFIVASLPLLVMAYYLCNNEQSFQASVFGFPLVSLGYGLLVIGAISPGSFLYNFRSGFTNKIAELSFAIYLSHKIVIHLTQGQFSGFGVEKDSWAMLAICVVCSVTAAFALNIAIEKPSLKLRNLLLRKMQ